MGTSHFDNDVAGLAGSEVIRGFATISATALVGPLTGNITGNVTGTIIGNITGNTSVSGGVTGNVTGSITGYNVAASNFFVDGNYIKLGPAYTYIIRAYTDGAEANIVAAATAVSASCRGSLILNVRNDDPSGEVWCMETNTTATKLKMYVEPLG